MMFFSRLQLNLSDRDVRRDLSRPYDMHRTLWRAFPEREAGGPRRVLFRVEPVRRSAPVVLVQSELHPDWTRLPGSYFAEPAEAKCVDFDGFAVGQRLRFRLRANPTRRVAEKNPSLGAVMAGKRIGIVGEAAHIGWLTRKGEHGGFRIPGEWIEALDPLTGEPVRLPNFRVNVIPDGRIRNDKPDAGGELLAVLFEGVLEITHPDEFVTTLRRGVGPGKAFGFGLLSVARA